MKKFEILWELATCDTEHKVEQMLFKNIVLIALLDAGLPRTFNLFKHTHTHTHTHNIFKV